MSENKEKMRVAVIGLGAAARNIHLPAYLTLKNKIEIVGGCDTDLVAGKTMQQRFGLKQIFDNPRKMIEITRPDIVSVCTPPFLHVDHALLALKHGCHVFCEKPLAENLASAYNLMCVAREEKHFVVVNNQFPYMNIHRSAKRLIGSAEFGQLLFLQAWQTFHPSPETEAGWRGQLKRRLCFEFGIHVFELVRYFFDAEPVRIYAQMPQPLSKNHSELLNLISLEFADGRAASIILNRLSKGPEHYLDMRLDGEFASIHTSIGGKVGLEAGIHTRGKRPFFDFNFVKGGSAILQSGKKSKIIAKDGINPFASSTAYHFSNFIKAIEEGITPPGTIEDNLKTLTLVFAAYDSAELHRTINISEYINNQIAKR